MLQLLGATGGKLAPQQSADLARFGVEHFAQDYVSISRASHDAQVFKNDVVNLTESLSKDVSKTSALDVGKTHLGASKVNSEQKRGPANQLAAGLALTL